MNRELVGIALRRLRHADQEILRLRHFEQQSNSQVAESLKVDASTASVLYVHALRRLKISIEAARSTFQPFAATTDFTPPGVASVTGSAVLQS